MKLHGVPVSNYYNIVKLALLEKNLPFTEVPLPPSQEPDFLELSPMGKIPILQDGDRYLTESQAILFYLELKCATPKLYPTDPWFAARAQQIHQFIDLYLDTPARRLLGAAFFGAQCSEGEIRDTGNELRRHVDALDRIIAFEPYIAGPQLTHADLAAFATLEFIHLVMERLKGPDPLTHLPGVGAYLQMLYERPCFERVANERDAALKQLIASQSA